MITRTRLIVTLTTLLACGVPLSGNAQITVTNHGGNVWTLSAGAPPEPSGGSQAIGLLRTPPAFIPTDPVQQPVPDPLAPALIGSFEAINFDTDAANAEFYHIPPDPIGAAGPNHLVCVVNTSIEWYTKAGVKQNSQRLGRNAATAAGSFFASLNPTNNTFDPKVIYDQHAGRFLVVTLERQGNSPGSPTNSSRILLAVSDDSDPNGTWYFAAFDSMINLGGTDTWGDYPGFAVDEEAVYITLNMFTFAASPIFVSSLVWIVDKSPFYSNGTPAFGVYDPGTLSGVGAVNTPQPAHVFGPAGVASGVGTFLVSSGWTDGSGNDFLGVIRVNNPLSSPTFVNSFISLGGDIHTGTVPDAPQSGTNVLIDAGDSRMYHAVWRDNHLYAVNTVNPPSGTDAGEATAHWYQIDTSILSALTLTDQGNIGGEDIAADTHTYYPSIAVDFQGNIGIGFAASAPTIFPGAYYTGRTNTETAGTVQTAGTLAAGVDHYIRTFGGARNRWGDYSGISLDPATESTFWVFNEYALTRGTVISGEDGRWGTRWGRFTFVNRAPLAANPGLGTRTNVPVTFSAHKLAADPDEDTITFGVSASSTAGGSVSLLNGAITYTPPAGFAGTDTFTYTADDGRGGTTNGTVTVAVRNAITVSLNIVSGPVVTNGNFVIRFAAIPGRTYTIEWSENATGPWAKADNRTAPTSNLGFGVGVFEFSEATGGEASRFYRTVYPAY
jgi:hypothetical protein